MVRGMAASTKEGRDEKRIVADFLVVLTFEAYVVQGDDVEIDSGRASAGLLKPFVFSWDTIRYFSFVGQNVHSYSQGQHTSLRRKLIS